MNKLTKYIGEIQKVIEGVALENEKDKKRLDTFYDTYTNDARKEEMEKYKKKVSDRKAVAHLRINELLEKFNEEVDSYYKFDLDQIDERTISILKSGVISDEGITALCEKFRYNPTMLRILDEEYNNKFQLPFNQKLDGSEEKEIIGFYLKNAVLSMNITDSDDDYVLTPYMLDMFKESAETAMNEFYSQDIE